MKVKIKSVLKSSDPRLKQLEDTHLVYAAGNNLCIGELGKPASDFVQLDKNNSRLYDFAVAPNNRVIFTAEQNQQSNRI